MNTSPSAVRVQDHNDRPEQVAFRRSVILWVPHCNVTTPPGITMKKLTSLLVANRSEIGLGVRRCEDNLCYLPVLVYLR